jgi:hypothetical protein
VLLKATPHLKFVTSRGRKNETKNFTLAEGVAHAGSLLGAPYMSATLFTAKHDMTLTYGKKGMAQLVTAKPTLSAAEPAPHDRVKAYLVVPDRPYLKALQVSDAEGRVKPSMQGKYRQICHFIEIVDGLLKETGAQQSSAPLSIIDIGSGKGYLTFALYDHLTAALGLTCRVTGIEMRDDLVQFCNRLARDLGFSGLSFENAEAAETSGNAADIIIALHACDTATDDAMALGIAADAKLIVAAPCCQHELAPQLDAPFDGLKGLTKYPLFKQRQADLVTDAARALLLEASGYKVKVIEFVATEHTAKNILIAAVKSAGVDRALARAQYQSLKSAAGFTTQHLAAKLKDI